VVVIEGGKTRIKEFASVSDWLDKHSDVLTRIKEFASVSDWLDKHSDVLIKYMKSHGLRTVS
jgi:hypothetical protein